TAAEMHDAIVARAGNMDVVVMAAAVADYAPVQRAGQKVQKGGEEMTIVLRKTPDILGELGLRRLSSGRGPLLVGFAAETENVVARAVEKRAKKHADLIVANDVSRSDAGFDVETNAVAIVGAQGAEALVAVREDIGDCTRCKLHTLGRTQVVFGVGNPDADLMFVGEAPGADEDVKGIPFVGRAGQLLTDIIEKGLQIPRSDVYIAN